MSPAYVSVQVVLPRKSLLSKLAPRVHAEESPRGRMRALVSDQVLLGIEAPVAAFKQTMSCTTMHQLIMQPLPESAHITTDMLAETYMSSAPLMQVAVQSRALQCNGRLL